MWNFFSSMLSGWQWLLLCSIPPAIVALYFLKLRRQPLEVPSTYLWQRTLEDMHVNSLWQKLRQSLLLLLQLILVALIMLACLRPSWEADRAIQDRSIIMIDTSASMTASDIEPTRLEEAKRQAKEIVKRMETGDSAMIISFSDRARVEQPFTTNRRQLERRLAGIQATQRTTDISEGLRAAGGRANPGRSADVPTEDATLEETANASIFADPLPADVYIFSDGGFRETPDFSWGNLQPKYVAIGTEKTQNAAIVAFSVDEPPSGGDQLQAFGQIKNFGEIAVDLSLELALSTEEAGERFQVIDAAEKTIGPGEMMGVEFTLAKVAHGILRLKIDQADTLELDNIAFAAINPDDQASVLFVTDGNDAIETVLSTEDSVRMAKVRTATVDTLSTDAFKRAAAAGLYDLIIFDECAPEDMPNANTLFFAAIPPGESWKRGERADVPQIIDTDLTHPLMNYLDFGDVNLVYATAIEGPTGAQVLIDSDAGAIATVAPRAGFEDVVLGFNMVYEEDGERYANTDWPRRLSFPLFFRNALDYLGGGSRTAELLNVRPGDALTFSAESVGEARRVQSPSGSTLPLKKTGDAGFAFFDTDEIGSYTITRDSSQPGPLRFTVNLFDETESDLGAKTEFETTWREVQAQAGFEKTRREIWPWIVVMAICVLLSEWYIYNQRVYL